jgi:hypothetical protein
LHAQAGYIGQMSLKIFFLTGAAAQWDTIELTRKKFRTWTSIESNERIAQYNSARNYLGFSWHGEGGRVYVSTVCVKRNRYHMKRDIKSVSTAGESLK